MTTFDGIQIQRLKYALSHELTRLAQEQEWLKLKYRAEDLYAIFVDDTSKSLHDIFGTDLDNVVPMGEYTIIEGILCSVNGVWNAVSVINFIDSDLEEITQNSPVHAAREVLRVFDEFKSMLINTLTSSIDKDSYEIIGVIASVLYYYL